MPTIGSHAKVSSSASPGCPAPPSPPTARPRPHVTPCSSAGPLGSASTVGSSRAWLHASNAAAAGLSPLLSPSVILCSGGCLRIASVQPWWSRTVIRNGGATQAHAAVIRFRASQDSEGHRAKRWRGAGEISIKSTIRLEHKTNAKGSHHGERIQANRVGRHEGARRKARQRHGTDRMAPT